MKLSIRNECKNKRNKEITTSWYTTFTLMHSKLREYLNCE